MDMKRFFLYAIAIAALALAGCGGNGGGGTAMMPDTPTTTPPTTTPPTTTPPTCLEDPAAANCTGPTAEEVAAKKKAVTKAAGTKMMAIMAEAAQTEDAGIGGSVETDETTTYSLAITRPSGGTEVKITDSAMMEDDDPKFVQMADLDGDGSRTMHVRDKRDANGMGEEEVVIVSTDIQAPVARPFAMAGENNENKGVYTLDTNTDNDATPPVARSLMVDTDNVGMWSSTGFPSTADTTRQYAQDDAATMDKNEGQVAGMFDGGSGTFECVSSNCSLVTDEDGKLTTVNGTWQFTPDADAMVYVVDADYMHYGFWLKRTTDADGLTYNEVETFAGSSIDASGDLTQVTGSATYNGGATGVYTRNNEYNSTTGDVIDRTSGHFTADVTLTAYFKQTLDDSDTLTVDEAGQIAPNMLDTVTGMITGFNLSHNDITSAWAVNLKGAINANAGTAAGTANGGGAEGNFNATFHGPTTDDTQPSSVVGEFDANFGNGAAAGGFGARKQ